MAKWQDVETFILQYLRTHNLGDGGKLPPDRDMLTLVRQAIPCSLQPLIRAMDELARKGILQRTPGSGTTVVSSPPLIDAHEFSFSHAATETYGAKLVTEVFEQTRRLPLPGDMRTNERKAQKVLGLKYNQAFYVIARKRILDGRPRAIHRSYLNPAHFPDNLLWQYDFAKVSLIAVFNVYDYRIETRRTTLRARFPTDDEMAILGIGREPILEAEQQLDAVQCKTGKLICIEYMRAAYVNWQYKISNRRAPEAAAA